MVPSDKPVWAWNRKAYHIRLCFVFTHRGFRHGAARVQLPRLPGREQFGAGISFVRLPLNAGCTCNAAPPAARHSRCVLGAGTPERDRSIRKRRVDGGPASLHGFLRECCRRVVALKGYEWSLRGGRKGLAGRASPSTPAATWSEVEGFGTARVNCEAACQGAHFSWTPTQCSASSRLRSLSKQRSL